MQFREIVVSDTNGQLDDVVGVNPAALAIEMRSTAPQIADDALRDREGNPVTPSHTREEFRANQLGGGAANSTLSQRITDRIAELRANAAGLRDLREERDPRQVIAQDELLILSQACLNAAAIPCSTLDPKRKFISTVPKPGFVVGDTAVMAVMLVRSGAPQWLAVLVGFSMALSTVMVGSQFGQMLTLAAQRRARGPASEDCRPENRDLFDDGKADTDLARWLGLGAATAGALLVAVTLIGIGQGDPPSLAFGFGLLGALTFGGAAGAEAYGTNAAADRRHDLETQRDAVALKLNEFERITYEATHDAELADSLLAAAEHAAVAASITVEAIADRTPDNPNIFGYTHPEPPTRLHSIAPRELPPRDREPKTREPHTRTIHHLTDPFSAGARSKNGTKNP